jgi:hypothetical protein
VVTLPTPYQCKSFSNYGFLISEIAEELLLPVKQEIEKIKNNFDKAEKANKILVGHVEKEFNLVETKTYLENLLMPLFEGYEKNFHLSSEINVNVSPSKWCLDSAWINFQKKHEFNPVHKHSGIFSFVIWIQVPYTIEEEKQYFPELSKNNKCGCFEFHYTNILGEIWCHTIPADKKYENKIIIFPAGLNHSVFPFYSSDEYRITISGNIKLKGLRD